MKDLCKVIAVDEERCVNCHACISACPVKYCNDASNEHVEIIDNLCIDVAIVLRHAHMMPEKVWMILIVS